MYPITQLPAPDGTVADGNTLVSRFPRSREIRAFDLSFLRASDAAQTRVLVGTEVSQVDIEADGRPLVHRCTTLDLQASMDYHGTKLGGSAANDSHLLIPMVDAAAPPVQDPRNPGSWFSGESLALGTEGLGSLECRLILGTLDVTTPLVRVRPYAHQTRTNGPPGLVRRYIRQDESGWSTVAKSLSLIRRPGEVMRRAHIVGWGSGVLATVEIYQGGQLVQRISAPRDLDRLAQDRGYTVQSGYRHLELGRVGHVLDGLSMDPADSPDIQLTWSTAPDSGSFRVMYDMSTEWSALGQPAQAA